MKTQFDYSKVRVSWTKYDIVHVTDLMESKETFTQFYEGHGGINIPILKAFIGVKELNDPIPDFWEKVFQWEKTDRYYFAVFLFSYTNSIQAVNMIIPSMKAPLRGEFIVPGTKESTNWRSFFLFKINEAFLIYEFFKISLNIGEFTLFEFSNLIAFFFLNFNSIFASSLPCFL